MAEGKDNNVFSHSMKSGLYVGGLLIAYDILYMQCILSSNVLMITIGGLLCFVGVVYVLSKSTKKFGQDVLDGKITYFKAFSFSFYTFFFASMIYAAYTYIYLRYMNPDGLLQVKDFYLGLFAQLEAEAAKNPTGLQSVVALNVPQYKEALDVMVKVPVATTAMDTLWANVFRSIFFCFIFSFFFRSKKKQP
ncbi:MAG: DUF4199 domain-containing protein [Paludibacteraceae bacterium]